MLKTGSRGVGRDNPPLKILRAALAGVAKCTTGETLFELRARKLAFVAPKTPSKLTTTPSGGIPPERSRGCYTGGFPGRRIADGARFCDQLTSGEFHRGFSCVVVLRRPEPGGRFELRCQGG